MTPAAHADSLPVVFDGMAGGGPFAEAKLGPPMHTARNPRVKRVIYAGAEDNSNQEQR